MTPDPTPQPHDHGAAGFCTGCAQAPDERTETVARDGLVDVAYRAWCDARKGKPGAPGEYEALYSRIEAGWMAQVVAAVVAALGKDDAGFWPALAGQNDRDAWAFMAERDAARAALDRVRALHKPVWDGDRGVHHCAECGADLTAATPDCPTVAVLDPEEGTT